VDVLREPVLAKPHRREELLEEGLARVNGGEPLRHRLLLVVVHDLDILRVTVDPAEADPPLVVDPDAVLPCSVAAEPLEPVPRGHPQVLEAHSGIERRTTERSRNAGAARPSPSPPPSGTVAWEGRRAVMVDLAPAVALSSIARGGVP